MAVSIRKKLLLSGQGPVRHTPVQYEVCTARYNYTRRDGTTNAGTKQSRNGTKIGTVHDLACTVPPCCRLVVRESTILMHEYCILPIFLTFTYFYSSPNNPSHCFLLVLKLIKFFNVFSLSNIY